LADSVLPPPTLPATAEAVLKFLESVGKRSEAELYWRVFRELPRESFAIVAPESSLVRQSGASIAEQLRFLADLGLFAPVVMGLLEPAQANVAADRLLRRLRTAGLEAAVYDLPQPDLAEAVRAELRGGQVPVLCFTDRGASLQERFEIVGRLARELGSRKLVLLRHLGAIGAGLDRHLELAPGHAMQMNADGISVINLRTDFELLSSRDLLPADDLQLLSGVRSLLESDWVTTLQANVTAPLALLRELFTVRGAGTLIKRGTSITRSERYDDVDCSRLKSLLESSFSRPLVPDFFEHPLLSVYHEPSYRAVAIIEPSPVAPVLSKFAVDPVAQGEGMGRDIWQAFVREYPRFIWRAKTNNPICSWYAWQCDGLVRAGKWTVYWRGIDPGTVPAVVAEMLQRPEDFQAV
jgi:acetylglutamate kinase